MTLSPSQFRPVEFSRSGKPKKPYSTKEEADRVASLHTEKYGTVAESYLGRDRQWYVTTNRRATADFRDAERRRNIAEMRSPLVSQDLHTRQFRHTGSGATVAAKVASMRPESPLHGQFLRFVAARNP
jgi:hypothetical protein